MPPKTDKKNKSNTTDFNDLHVAQGLPVVEQQLLAALTVANDSPAPPFEDVPPPDDDYVNAQTPAPPVHLKAALTLEEALQQYHITTEGSIWDSFANKFMKVGDFKRVLGSPKLYASWEQSEDRRMRSHVECDNLRFAAQQQGGGGLAVALDRYVYLNPSSQAWDKSTRNTVALADLRYAIADCFDQWLKNPLRKEIKKENLVFDPTGAINDSPDHINRFTGFTIEPNKETHRCAHIIEVLRQLCNCETEAFEWVKKWLAYPLQNPGAKMATAILMHSDVHGSGKSLFFDPIMSAIYGRYAKTFGQAQLESQYNDWISETLFGCFEEVLSRGQKYAHTGTLKQMITGKKLYVEKKFLSGWEEANHMNCVFLSNEVQPLPVEPSDRRFLVVWPETKLYDDLMEKVLLDLADGGAEAFYYYLKNLELGDFNEHTKPPMTEAKKRLIDFGLPSWLVFFEEWERGELDVPFIPCMLKQLFVVYTRWCNQCKEHAMGQNKFSGFIASKVKRRRDLHYGEHGKKGTFFLPVNCPEKKNQAEWLGECVEEVDKVLRNLIRNDE